MPESGAPFDGGEDLVQRRGAPHLGVPLHCQHAAAGRVQMSCWAVADNRRVLKRSSSTAA